MCKTNKFLLTLNYLHFVAERIWMIKYDIIVIININNIIIRSDFYFLARLSHIFETLESILRVFLQSMV